MIRASQMRPLLTCLLDDVPEGAVVAQLLLQLGLLHLQNGVIEISKYFVQKPFFAKKN